MDHIDRKIIDILQNNARSPLKGDRRPCVFVQPCCVGPHRPARKLGSYLRLSGAGRCPQAGVHGQGLHQSGYGPPAQAEVLPLYPKLPPCGGVQLRHQRLQYADRGAVRHNYGSWTSSSTICSSSAAPAPRSSFLPPVEHRGVPVGSAEGGMITGIPRSAAGRSSPSASGRKRRCQGDAAGCQHALVAHILAHDIGAGGRRAAQHDEQRNEFFIPEAERYCTGQKHRRQTTVLMKAAATVGPSFWMAFVPSNDAPIDKSDSGVVRTQGCSWSW